MNIVVDDEFKALIPPLQAEERAQLEANILADGCRDPLVVWPIPEFTEEDTGITFKYAESRLDAIEVDGEWKQIKVWDAPDGGESYDLDSWPCVLVDGHNRYEICTRHGLPFEVVTMEFESKADARIWMRSNQKGRRNLTPAWVIELALGNKEDLKEIGKKTQGSRTDILSVNDKKSSPEVVVADRSDSAAKQLSSPEAKPEKHNTRNEIAKAAGVSSGQVGMAEQVRKKAPELWEKAKQGEVSISSAYTQVKRAEKEEKREERREENRAKVAEVVAPEQIVEVGAKFATITIDPPWDWGDEGDQDQLGRARPDYSTMSISQLMDLPVPDLADDDCHIYLWITNRSLPKGFALLEKWGFRYITALTWVKPHFGMGNYFRGQTEHVLFGVKGSQMLKRKDIGTVFNAPRGPNGHSSKPAEFYELVESCSPGPYLEMFSRTNREDWTTWGENAHAAA